MRINVLLDILFELLQKRKLTARYLSEKYELSPRTVYRYVEKLSENVPLQVTRGRNGGICLSDCYKLPENFLTATEYADVQDALAIAYERYGNERFLETKNKFSAQKHAETKAALHAEELGVLFIDGSGWDDSGYLTEKLRLMQTCIQERFIAEIEYLTSRNERNTTRIEPHALFFRKNAWSVYAFCHKKRAFRTFALGKIRSAVQTRDRFLKRDFKQEFPVSAPPVNKLAVRLEISKNALSSVQEWLGMETVRQQNDKWYADVLLPDDETLTGKLLAFGAGLRVVEPKSLREKIAKELKKTMSLYT